MHQGAERACINIEVIAKNAKERRAAQAPRFSDRPICGPSHPTVQENKWTQLEISMPSEWLSGALPAAQKLCLSLPWLSPGRPLKDRS